MAKQPLSMFMFMFRKVFRTIFIYIYLEMLKCRRARAVVYRHSVYVSCMYLFLKQDILKGAYLKHINGLRPGFVRHKIIINSI